MILIPLNWLNQMEKWNLNHGNNHFLYQFCFLSKRPNLSKRWKLRTSRILTSWKKTHQYHQPPPIVRLSFFSKYILCTTSYPSHLYMYSVYLFIYRKCGKNLYAARTLGAKDRLQSLRGQTGEWIIQIVQAWNPYRYRRGSTRIQSSGRDHMNQWLMSQKAWHA